MKTLPEKMADILFQSLSDIINHAGVSLVDSNDPVSILITPSVSNGRTVLGRQVNINVGELEFFLAIDMPIEFYRPYKDSELDACLLLNVNLLMDNQQHKFMSAEDAEAFADEIEEIVKENTK